MLDVGLQSGGRLLGIDVAPDQTVRRGQVVARIDQPEMAQEVASLKSSRDELLQDRARLLGFQSTSGQARAHSDAAGRQGLEHSIALAQQRLGFYHERAGQLQQLFSQGLALRQSVVAQQIEIGKTEEEISGDTLKLQQQQAQDTDSHIADQKEVLDLDLKIADASRRYQAAVLRLGAAETVVSPYDGRVVELKHNRGELVQAGGSLLSLLPQDALVRGADRQASAAPASLILVLFVPAADGKRIRPGMVAEISPTTVKREEYGGMLGHVLTVAAVPSTEEGMMRTLKNQQLVASLAAHGAPFEVDVALDPDRHTASGYRWSSSAGPNTTIGPGALADAAVRVNQLRLIEIAIPATQRLFQGDR